MPENNAFIFDVHLDLSMNALEWNRDLSRTLAEVREREAGQTDKPDRAKGTVSLPEMRRGNIGLCVGTQIARYTKRNNPLPGWHSPAQAWAQTQGQLAWYRELEQKGELTQITNLEQLDAHLAKWESGPTDDLPVGYILSLEGADSIVTLGHLEQAYASGLRALGPAHYGPGTYAPGTDESGPLGQAGAPEITSTLSRDEYCNGVRRIIDYIWQGDIYQANLTHRLEAKGATNTLDGWTLYRRLATASPAPFSAFMQCGEFQLASSSPEQFLQLSGNQVTTRPIKGTRPRGTTPDLDARLGYELQSSEKERSELVMITDLLRNDLGRFCEFGSVSVPDLAKLERFAQVQHLVSTVTGRLRPGVTHLQALASSFPGGSITGAPKIRAMEIIDELEPVVRGPYTGCLGYLGFNRESQLNILIRTAVCRDGAAWFHVGAGIVADSDPEAEYEETLNKAAGWLAALKLPDSALALSPATG